MFAINFFELVAHEIPAAPEFAVIFLDIPKHRENQRICSQEIFSVNKLAREKNRPSWLGAMLLDNSVVISVD